MRWIDVRRDADIERMVNVALNVGIVPCTEALILSDIKEAMVFFFLVEASKAFSDFKLLSTH